MKVYNISILGASGYTAVELINIALNHPNIKIVNLFGNSKAGQNISNIYPHLKFENLPKITKFDINNLNNTDILFSCLPHGELQKIIGEIPSELKIIDVSADFRLQNLKLFEEYYNSKHLAETFTNQAIYALPEISKTQILDKRIIACPGCYPTSILLPLIPLVTNKKLSNNSIIIDSKSGISGSGRKLSETNLFCELNENIKPYNIQKHRHLAEIIENLEKINSEEFEIQFTPQTIPISRGILSTIYIRSKDDANSLKASLRDYYQSSDFIHINMDDSIPALRNITGTNKCEINIFDKENSDLKIIISVIDNLNRGSSGQAIQNFNILFNLPESTGLSNSAKFP
jgi:N-acetyl-gamma-glutamyl-phosphate reductase